jgi:hypothetical protein
MAIEPKKFAPIYDKLERELASVLHAPGAQKQAKTEVDEVSRARDVQHIVSIVFSLVEHERAALTSSVSMTRERARKSQQQLSLQLEQQSDHFKKQGVKSGARLLRALARTLVDERPMRRCFGKWSRQCAAFRAREYEALASKAAQASRRDQEFSALKSDQLEDLLAKVREHGFNCCFRGRESLAHCALTAHSLRTHCALTAHSPRTHRVAATHSPRTHCALTA